MRFNVKDAGIYGDHAQKKNLMYALNARVPIGIRPGKDLINNIYYYRQIIDSLV
jgi:hypothetical protein